MAKEKKENKGKKTKVKVDYDKLKNYSIEEALGFVKQMAQAKFDETIEIHLKLGIDPRKGDQQVRGAVSLPHGTGKTVRVAAFVSPEKEKECKEAGADIVGGEELITEIKRTEKTDFQVAVAEPAMMRLLAPIAKILGTRGLMPSPKNETVTPNPALAVQELKKGKISFKNDDTSNLHAVIGKVSFDIDKLVENYKKLIDTIKKVKPSTAKGVYIKNVTICSTMGSSVKLIAEK